jgi:hypothetical protein
MDGAPAESHRGSGTRVDGADRGNPPSRSRGCVGHLVWPEEMLPLDEKRTWAHDQPVEAARPYGPNPKLLAQQTAELVPNRADHAIFCGAVSLARAVPFQRHESITSSIGPDRAHRGTSAGRTACSHERGQALVASAHLKCFWREGVLGATATWPGETSLGYGDWYPPLSVKAHKNSRLRRAIRSCRSFRGKRCGQRGPNAGSIPAVSTSHCWLLYFAACKFASDGVGSVWHPVSRNLKCLSLVRIETRA